MYMYVVYMYVYLRIRYTVLCVLGMPSYLGRHLEELEK